MKTQNKTFFKTLCTMVALLAFTFSSYATPPGGGGGGASSGGPANQIPGTGQGQGGPGEATVLV